MSDFSIQNAIQYDEIFEITICKMRMAMQKLHGSEVQLKLNYLQLFPLQNNFHLFVQSLPESNNGKRKLTKYSNLSMSLYGHQGAYIHSLLIKSMVHNCFSHNNRHTVFAVKTAKLRNGETAKPTVAKTKKNS